jgi:hypothetical protein
MVTWWCCGYVWLIVPSGKHTKNYGKSPFSMGKSTINPPFSMGKSTISMAIFNSKLLVYQRVVVVLLDLSDLSELSQDLSSIPEIVRG